MKKFLILSLASLASVQAFAGFTDGNIVVLHTAGSLTADSGTVSLREFLPSTTAQTSPLTNVSITNFAIAGSSVSGGLSVSADSGTPNRLAFYVPGLSAVSSTQGRIAKISQDFGTGDAQTITWANVGSTSLRQFAAGQAQIDPTTFVATSGSATRYAPLTFSSTPSGTGPSSTGSFSTSSSRGIAHRPGGGVFVATSGTIIQLSGVGGGTAGASVAADPTQSDLTGLAFTDANTMWAVDGSVGLLKFTFNGTAWVQGSTFGLATTGFAGNGGRWITSNREGTELYITTAESSNNRLLRITDLNTTPVASVLATSGASSVFRGVAVVPEPATMAALGLGLAGLAARRRRK